MLLRNCFFCGLLFVLSQNTFGQTGIVAVSGTLEDLYPKRIGSLRFSKTTMHFADVYSNEKKVDTIKIFNNGQTTISISKTAKLPDYIKTNVQPNELLPQSEATLIIEYDVAIRKEFGFLLERIILLTNDSEMPEKNLNITLNIKEYFPPADVSDTLFPPKVRLDERTYNFGRLQQGEKNRHDFIIHNDGQHDLLIHQAKSTCGCVKANFSKIILQPGDSTVVMVEFDSFGKDGIVSNELSLFVNDPNQPEVKLIITGDVWK